MRHLRMAYGTDTGGSRRRRAQQRTHNAVPRRPLLLRLSDGKRRHAGGELGHARHHTQGRLRPRPGMGHGRSVREEQPLRRCRHPLERVHHHSGAHLLPGLSACHRPRRGRMERATEPLMGGIHAAPAPHPHRHDAPRHNILNGTGRQITPAQSPVYTQTEGKSKRGFSYKNRNRFSYRFQTRIPCIQNKASLLSKQDFFTTQTRLLLRVKKPCFLRHSQNTENQ